MSTSKEGTSPPSALRQHLAARGATTLVGGSVQVSGHQDPQVLSCLSSWSAGTGACPSLEKNFVFLLVELCEIPASLFPACPGPSGWHHGPLAHHPSLPVWCQQQELSKGHPAPSSRSLKKMLIRAGARSPRTDPWHTESVTGCQLNFVPPITTQPLPQFSIHSLSLLLQPQE